MVLEYPFLSAFRMPQTLDGDELVIYKVRADSRYSIVQLR
jgi:hypothetical protein